MNGREEWGEMDEWRKEYEKLRIDQLI